MSISWRGDKADIYAASGLPEYWIIVPEERVIEVYRDPSPTGYRTSVRCADAETVLRPGLLPQAAIRLSKVFE